MKKILITGAYGQDGVLLSKIFIKNKYKVYGFVKKKIKPKKKNLNYFNIKNRNYSFIKNKLNQIKPDIVIHLGSSNPSFYRSFNKKDYLFNLKFTKNLIDYVTKNKNIKFILPSTSQIFKTFNRKINENSKIKLSNYYTKFRIESSNYLLKMKKKFKLNANIIILFNHDSKFRNPRFLLPRLIRAIKKRNYSFIKKIYLYNINGDFSHALDICNGIYLLIKKNKNPDKIIFSSGKRTYVNDIIRYFIPNIKNYIIYNKIGNTKLNIGDNKKAIKMLNWKIKKSSLDAAKDIFKLKL
tara:strand:+ start:33 stop:920 length:888 start_codon:yes stop_codon:yes gene_type:complete